MDNRAGLPSGTQQRCPGFDPTLKTWTSPLSGPRNEKELMHGLNDRLAGFIGTVHQLEEQNHLLEREIQELRGTAKPASRLEEEYGPELRRLRRGVQDIARQKHRTEIEHQDLEEELSSARRQHEQEARGRSDAQSHIVALKKDIDDAYRAKLQLDKKAQCLVDEIHVLKRNHEAEVGEMFGQIQDLRESVEAHGFGAPGVTAALRDVRAQLEGHAVSDVRQVEETFRSQFARLTEAAESKREGLKATQQEVQEYRRRLQATNTELDCAKGTGEALEKQLREVEDRHEEEIIHYQKTIKELENELINCKFDVSGYLREYQDLLNVKMALDVEILSYRKLLCSEEARLSTMSESHVSLPYIYHQSPIYTLPCLKLPGGPHRRAEPQYKFVEEIITETTREIEMSEFEDTGSEETEAGTDVWGCAKRDRGASEEEEEDHSKDSREEESEQVSDSQQNESGNPVSGGDGRDPGSPGGVEDGEKGQDGKEESEETEDKKTQSKVLFCESRDEEENEVQKKVPENTKEEKVPVPKATIRKEFKSEVTAEENHVNTEKQDALKDNFSSIEVRKPVDEVLTKESGKTELSSTVRVQDKKSSDCTTEIKSTVSLETEELSERARATSSTTLQRGEEENSRAERREIDQSESEREKEDQVAESTKEAGRDKGRDKDSSETCLAAAKDQAKSEDETETALTIVKTASEEIKQSGSEARTDEVMENNLQK